MAEENSQFAVESNSTLDSASLGAEGKEVAISRVAEEAIRNRVFPGCVVGYFSQGQSKILPFGRLTYQADAPVVHRDTYYDVASITKSIPTNSLVLKLIEQGQLRLDDPVCRYIPEIDHAHREQVRIRHLLTYTVVLKLSKGMSAYVRDGLDVAGLWNLLYTSSLTAPPGEHYFYSNAPAIMLGLIAERLTGQSLDTLAAELFFKPLEMKHTTFHSESLPKEKVAPSEIDWRGEVHGSTHDEMAWLFRKSGHIAGNAGLFTTAGDLLRFAIMILNGGEHNGIRYFQPETVQAMQANQLDYLGESTGLGWELNQPRFMGSTAGPHTFGKTGFTGCIILMNSAINAAMVLLSNRTYPQRPASRDPINDVRCRIADIIFSIKGDL